MEKNKGICAVCQKEKELTYEHYPPKSVNNKTSVKKYTSKEVMEAFVKNEKVDDPQSRREYTQLQRGHGGYTLCRKCNNETGTNYADEYQIVANGFIMVLNDEETSRLDEEIDLLTVRLKLKPLNFIKQVLTMFCSIDGLALNANKDLRNLVLDKYSKTINKDNVRIFMYITKSSIFKTTSALIGSTLLLVDEISFAPFGFSLYSNYTSVEGMIGWDITDFFDYDYNQEEEMSITVPIMEIDEERLLIPNAFKENEKEKLRCLTVTLSKNQ
ncbi:TPA_asm: hypothetical protein GYO99_04630 [Listeria monocytogenes]|nr:hypothetical protein [Listeria monocytogenes]HAB7636891.1 hypothetical protein [Listeria monocytogenes]